MTDPVPEPVPAALRTDSDPSDSPPIPSPAQLPLPFFWTGMLFLCGIAVVWGWGPFPWWPTALLFLLMGVMGFALGCLHWKKIAWTLLVLAIITGGALRALLIDPALPLQSAELHPLSGSTDSGRLLAAFPYGNPQVQAPVDVELLVTAVSKRYVYGWSATGKVEMTSDADLLPWGSEVRLFLASESSQPVSGRTQRVKGTFRSFRQGRNPGVWTYEDHLVQSGVLGEIKGIGHSVSGHATPFWLGLRVNIERFMERSLPEDQAALLKALILGDTSALEYDLKQSFALSGSIHILSVSGFHVALVTAVLVVALGLFRLPRRVVYLLAGGFTVCYVLLVGAPVPAIRAGIMACVFLLGRVVGRNGNALNSLGLAGLIILLWDPRNATDPGFQLSFAVTGALLWAFGYGRLNYWAPSTWQRHPVLSWTWTALGASLVSWLAALPIVVYHFGRLAWVGLIADLPIIPLAALSTIWGLIGVLLGGLWESLGAIFLRAAGGSAALMAWLVSGAARINGSGQVIPWSMPVVFLVLLGVVILLALMAYPRSWKLRGASFAVAAILLIALIWPANPPQPEVTLFDLAGGHAIYLSAPPNRVLVDCSSSADARRVVLPWLARRGIAALDGLVWTRPVVDRIGGSDTLLETLRPSWVADRLCPHTSNTYLTAVRCLDSLGLDHRRVAAREVLTRGFASSLSVAWPDSADSDSLDCARKPVSLVLSGSLEGMTVLLLSDLDLATVRTHFSADSTGDRDLTVTSRPEVAAWLAGPEAPFSSGWVILDEGPRRGNKRVALPAKVIRVRDMGMVRWTP